MRHSHNSILLVDDADNMLLSSLNIIDKNYGKNDLRKADYLRARVQTNWFFRNMKSALEPSNQSSLVDTSAQQQPFLNLSEENRQLSRKYARAEDEGESALQDLIRLYRDNPNGPPGAEEQAIVNLGDWYLTFGDQGDAFRAYDLAYTQLVQDEREEVRRQVEKLFGRPVSLPELPLLESIEGVEEPETRPVTGHVTVQFDVTRYGRTKNIQIVDSLPENHIPRRKRIKSLIAGTRFRPRYIDGAAVDTEHMVLRYVFRD
jgi:hypothetical protein